MAAIAPHVLALDLGTSGMKVALCSYDGTITGWASSPINLILLPDGGVEQRPEDWWQALITCTRKLRHDHPAVMDAVQLVCASTQGEGTIAVDDQQQPITNCITWMDMRGAAQLRQQFAGKPSIGGLGLGHVIGWIHKTGGMPSPTGKDPAAHMLFIRDTMPEIYDRTHAFLNVLDYINLRLTGTMCTTVDSIITSWVTDNRNPHDIYYDETLIKKCGIDREKFPPIVACTADLGTVLPHVADELGVRATAHVIAGAIDNTAAAIGAGTTGTQQVHLYLGTSSWLAAHVKRKKTDVKAGIASLPCAIPGSYLLTALQSSAGGNFTYLNDHVFSSTTSCNHDPHQLFQIYEQLLHDSKPGAGGVLYAPWLHGERAPVDDLSLRATLCNVSLHNTKADLVRAVYEGIGFNTRWLLGPVERFLGQRVEQIALVGGGARSAGWAQILADILGTAVHQIADPLYANARGAAFIAAVGAQEICFDDVANLVQVQRVFEPRAQYRSTYDQCFRTFVDIHRRLAPVYRRINRGG